MPSDDMPERLINPSAAIYAWLWPGLGHISIGQKRRGLLVMFGVLFLFFSGLLVGGLDCVDRRNASLWFCAQSGCGPITFAADNLNQRLIQSELPRNWKSGSEAEGEYREQDPQLLKILNRDGVSHVNEIGTLFIALAGLMNIVVVLDVLYFLPKPDTPHGDQGGDA